MGSICVECYCYNLTDDEVVRTEHSYQNIIIIIDHSIYACEFQYFCITCFSRWSAYVYMRTIIFCEFTGESSKISVLQ